MQHQKKILPGLSNLPILFTLALSTPLNANNLQSLRPGLLDTPIVELPQTQLPAAATMINQQALEREIREEQELLETLPREQLLDKAEAGERAAQVALGADYAKEAAELAFSPAAANAALSDAARWYSLAASRGFPGAPSLDRAGVRFYPIRIQRLP
jgi:TPR repeat protein